VFLLIKLFSLLVDPSLELRDRFPLHGKLDVGIGGVDLRAWGMTHEGHTNLLQDSGLHEARVEGVAEIMKADMADLGVLQRRFPGALDDADRLAPKADD